jgi:GMP synthase (glutamine-hydrolysing)
VPSAAARFGPFSEMVKRAAGDAFDGEWLTLDMREQPELPATQELAGVIVSGSPARVSEGLPWMRRASDYLATLLGANVPTLGICFGHQLLGDAVGGRVLDNPRGREIGTVDCSVAKASPLFDELGPIRVNASHLDSVQGLPPGTTTHAESELEPHALVHFGARSWGVQFHPEFDGAIVRCYIEERRAALIAEGRDPELLLANAEDTPASRRVIPNFIRRVVL